MIKTTEELTNQLYTELKKEFIKDIIKIMDSTCPEYITPEGKGFLDGLSASGEVVEVVTKDKYDELKQEGLDANASILHSNKGLEETINDKQKRIIGYLGELDKFETEKKNLKETIDKLRAKKSWWSWK